MNFGDLANLLRKVRIDLGVEIKIDLKKLRQDEDSKETKSHYAVGTIEYPEGTEGILIYINSSTKRNLNLIVNLGYIIGKVVFS